MTEQRKATDVVLNNFLYAPLGLVVEARSLVPQLAEKGRMTVSNARLMGQLAVQKGREEASRQLGGLEGQVQEMLVGFGLVASPVDHSSQVEPVPVPDIETQSDAEPAVSSVEPQDVPDVKSLAIPDYDSLAASQVVSRLAGLRPVELGDVQTYELAKRGRKTILGKIAQLQAT